MNNNFEIIENKHGKDYSGEKFGRLTVIGLDKERYYYGNGRSSKKWVCRCDCGNIVSLMPNEFIFGKTKSCGCLKREMDELRINLKDKTTHGDCSNGKITRLFQIWCGIRSRCYNSNFSIFNYYGGRGIKMCDEWLHDYSVFKSWAFLNGYNDNDSSLTIDRIDVNGNYCPENCRWVTRKEQANNRRSNTFLEYNNVTKTIAEWSLTTGIKQSTIWRRINVLGWTVEEALTIPTCKYLAGQRKKAIKDGIYEKRFEGSEQD